MTDEVAALAEAHGVAASWRDYRGDIQDVRPEHLRAVLAALGIAASTDAEVAESLTHVHAERDALPALVTAVQGQPLELPGAWEVAFEGGGHERGEHRLALDQIGYHRLRVDDRETILAVAPRRCHPLPDGRPWGIAVQLYGLRRTGDGGIGDFPALERFAIGAARHGADAVAISPVHAQFSADPDRFSPYAPSSRVMLNVLHAEASGDAELEAAELVDWPAAARVRLTQFRERFETGIDQAVLAAFRGELGEPLERHARFEALQTHLFGTDPGRWHWRTWPQELRDPASPVVAAFAADHEREVTFHAWLQLQADTALGRAQASAKAAGMRIGLVADLAVGADSGGSQAWSRQDEVMIGLTVGAPPDLLNKQGQNWGISAFSPLGLRRHGYSAFIEMLRSALRHAGGVRIDHAMGLQRLWVVPDGAAASAGAYLQFPVDDMMRLVALESYRHQAVVLGEDLGTLPDGFHERLIGTGLLGMRVLWFEREQDWIRPPGEWAAQAVGMTSTHDLPTVAGWWRGHDIEWRERLGMIPDLDAEHRARAHDRHLLWNAMRASGAASGDAPATYDTWPVVGAALDHVARSACHFVLLPVEDILARDEQPNLPGTITQHPNWRRRLPGPAEALLDTPEATARLDRVKAARG